MKAPVRSFIIRDATGTREAETLVLGRGLRITETAGGLPELEGVHGSEVLLGPSGGDDTQAVNDALATGKDVRLGPGNFTISDTLVVGAAGSQRLGGSGAGRTHVKLTTAGIPAVAVTSGSCTVERLRLNGVSYNSGKTGIRAVSPLAAPGLVTIRDLHVHGMAEGIHLESVVCDVSGVDVSWGGEYGIYARGVRGTLRDLNLTVDAVGIRLEDCEGVVCESVRVIDTTEAAVHLLRGTSCRLSALYLITAGGPGLIVEDAVATSVDAVLVAGGGGGGSIRLDGANGVTLNACTVKFGPWALVVVNSVNVVAGALHLSSSYYHMFVATSRGVFITGVEVEGGGRTDVSQAGSRVLFGPNNFAPGSINSGGNFAAL